MNTYFFNSYIPILVFWHFFNLFLPLITVMVLSPQVITPGWVGLLVFSCSIMSWLCDPMDCSMPGFLVLHYLLEFAQKHVHQVEDAIKPSHPLLSPPPALSLSQNQSPFQWAGSSHQVARVLELQPQHQSFQWIFRVDFLEDWLVWCPCYRRDSQKSFSCTTVWKYQFFGSAFFMVQLWHLHMTTGKTIALTICTFVSKVISLLFSTLSRFVIAFLPRNKHILISWLQSPSAVILESRNGLVGLIGLNLFL